MEKITISNYYNTVKGMDWHSMPDGLKEGHEFIQGLHTDGTKDFQLYSLDKDIQATVDLYFTKLREHLSKPAQPSKPAQRADKQPAKQAKPVKQRPAKPAPKAAAAKPAPVDNDPEDAINYSERMPDEIRFIKRYIALHDKVKTKDEILRFIKALQKSILEKRIRKTSEYAADIEKIQKDLVDTYNKMKGRATFVISKAAVEKYREKTAGERVYLSVQYLNRFRNIIGKAGMKKKAAGLAAFIKKALSNGKITKKDPYHKQLEMVLDKIGRFTKDRSAKSIEISQQQLNGLEGILNGADLSGVYGLDGFAGTDDTDLYDRVQRPQIMNSLDFVNMKFDTLGFTGKWREFIGDPSRNFTAMVFGKPKFGKSFLCIDFAGYLARYHGNVLYVAKEETLDLTLQEKLKDKNVAHQNLTVAAELPANLAPYDFVFLDSVSKLGYTPQDLDRLKALNPAKSFVYIFQTTKDGNFRGVNSYQHDVDIVIEVPEPGLATQMGRFNQGGTMQIFD
jgi:hypothetical protein